MNKTIAVIALAAALFTAHSAKAQQAEQTQEGYSYFLPKTALRISVLVEKTTTTPGELCIYADRYLKKGDVALQERESYRIVSISIATEAVRDTARQFILQADAKHCINHAEINRSGILTAINTTGKAEKEFTPFVSWKKPAPKDPREFMNQEILAAGSRAKMAELTAREIYDIRDSRNELTRGQADFMPKDGEQLRLMLKQLDTQEQALLQMFCGTTVCDTMQSVIRFVPNGEVTDRVLFRFSEKLGMLDADDLAGTPYYINIENMQDQMPSPETPIDNAKPSKDDIGLRVVLPGKARATITTLPSPQPSTLNPQPSTLNPQPSTNNAQPSTLNPQLSTPYSFWAAQFGTLLNLSGDLFSKKMRTELTLEPTTGAVETIKTELLKK